MNKNLNKTNITVPDDFNYYYYWLLNDDLQTKFDKNDSDGLIYHWITQGHTEQKQYNISSHILNNFDHKIYYTLYDDLQIAFNKDDYNNLLSHYVKFGIKEKRICSIDEIILPDDFFSNKKYSSLTDTSNLSNIFNFPHSYKIKINYFKNKMYEKNKIETNNANTKTNISQNAEQINNLPYNFNHLFYWCVNEDLRSIFDKDNKKDIINHWIKYGSKEKRNYQLPSNIISKFDHKIYYSLYEDIQTSFDKDDYDNLIIHYYLFGKNENRICSIDEIVVPDDFNTNTKYNHYKNLSNFNSLYDLPYSYKIKINYYKLLTNINSLNTNNVKEIIITNKDVLFIVFNFDNSINKHNDYKIIKDYENVLIIGPNNPFFKKNNKEVKDLYQYEIYFFYQIIYFLIENGIHDSYNFYYYSNNFNISNNYVNKLKNSDNLIISNFNYCSNQNSLTTNENNFAFNANFIEKIKTYINKNTYSSELTFSSIVSLINLNYKIPILLIFYTDQNGYDFMYKIWIKNITSKFNVNIIIMSTSEINTFEHNCVCFYKMIFDIEKMDSELSKVLSFANKKNIIYDWIIFANKKLFINTNIIQNTIKKWYDYDVLSINNDLFCFKQNNIGKLPSITSNINNINSNEMKLCNDSNIINYINFQNCNKDSINKYFIVDL